MKFSLRQHKQLGADLRVRIHIREDQAIRALAYYIANDCGYEGMSFTKTWFRGQLETSLYTNGYTFLEYTIYEEDVTITDDKMNQATRLFKSWV